MKVRYFYTRRTGRTKIAEQELESVPKIGDKIEAPDKSIWKVSSVVKYPDSAELEVVPYYFLRNMNRTEVKDGEFLKR